MKENSEINTEINTVINSGINRGINTEIEPPLSVHVEDDLGAEHTPKYWEKKCNLGGAEILDFNIEGRGSWCTLIGRYGGDKLAVVSTMMQDIVGEEAQRRSRCYVLDIKQLYPLHIEGEGRYAIRTAMLWGQPTHNILIVPILVNDSSLIISEITGRRLFAFKQPGMLIKDISINIQSNGKSHLVIIFNKNIFHLYSFSKAKKGIFHPKIFKIEEGIVNLNQVKFYKTYKWVMEGKKELRKKTNFLLLAPNPFICISHILPPPATSSPTATIRKTSDILSSFLEFIAPKVQVRKGLTHHDSLELGDSPEEIKDNTQSKFIRVLSVSKSLKDVGREITSIKISPDNSLALLADQVARILLLDLNLFLILRIWKGYRDASIEFYYITNIINDKVSMSRKYVVIMSGQRATVEVWRLKFGGKVFSQYVTKYSKMFSTFRSKSISFLTPDGQVSSFKSKENIMLQAENYYRDQFKEQYLCEIAKS